ncbi:MAG: Spy/CpxP family protein refolding chaperone [Syntrophobacteraceae bacterium]
MKDHVRQMFFVASIALNIAFCSTYLIYKISSIAGVSPQPSRQPVFLQLDLTSEQSGAFSSERDRFHARLQEWGDEIKIRQMELIDLLEAGASDQQAVERKQEEIQRLQRIVQDGVIVHVLQGRSLLTPEQRSRFFQLIKDRIDDSVQACPPWMKPLDGKRLGESKRD